MGSKQSSQQGGVLVIVLIMLIPITLFAVNLMSDTRLLWLSTLNLKDTTIADSLLSSQIYEILNVRDVNKSNKNSQMISREVGFCQRSFYANSLNTHIRCQHQVHLIQVNSSVRRYLYVYKFDYTNIP